MKKFEYLILDVIILFSPFLGRMFYKNFSMPNVKYFLISTFLASIIFLIWDFLVTNRWWHFNDEYLIGLKVFNLPIEEVIFFPAVSFSCFLIWINLKKIFLGSFSSNFISLFTILLLALSLFLSVYFFRKKRFYTSVVLISQVLVIIFDFLLETKLILLKSFWLFIIIILFLTFIFNFYLTSRPIVLYKESYKSGKKIFSIPIEDFIYGVVFLYLNLLIYEFLIKL